MDNQEIVGAGCVVLASFVLWQWHELWKHADQSLKSDFAIVY